MIRTATPLCLLALALAALGCQGDVGDSPPPAQPCDPALGENLWLLPFGPLAHEVITGSQVELSTIVTLGSEVEGEGSAQSGRQVSFRLINPGSDSTLSAPVATTGADGLATVSFLAGSAAKVFQVEASLGGLCPTTFSVDVRKPLRQLRAVTPSPFDTFTLSRIPVVVEASTNANARLAGETVSFRLELGKTGETILSTTEGQGAADTLTVQTNASGRAIAMLTTGSQPIPQLKVFAAMEGTAEVQLTVRISQGSGEPCQSDWECPLGYACKTGICEAPPVTPSSGCQSDDDCADPMVCYLPTNQCMTPTGAPCDYIEGTGCQAGEVCVGGQCAVLPSGCQSNFDCPPTWVCQNGVCVPSGGQECQDKAGCPSGQVCINGKCLAQEVCAVQHALDRLKGSWQLDSLMHFRDALSPFLEGILGAAGLLRDIMNGNFDISGIPSFIEKLVGDYLAKLIKTYVPEWGQALITALGGLNDIVDDMRVYSTLQLTSVGNDRYAVNEQWNLVEFDYNGKVISSPPSAVPQIGQVKIPPYGAGEVCGVLFIDKHQLNNVVGGLVKWAIETGLSLVTCSATSSCYNSVDQALQVAINCQALAYQIDALVKAVWSGAPSVATPIRKACDGNKDKLIKMLTGGLASLTTELSLLELSGTATIPNPGQDNVLQDGKWFGVLGSSAIKGNFEGEFSARR